MRTSPVPVKRGTDEGVTCPRCGSDAHYKYGKTRGGKERYLCLACNRQYVTSPERQVPVKRPLCPACGKPMHVYMRDQGHTRYRCMDYPECRTFLKL